MEKDILFKSPVFNTLFNEAATFDEYWQGFQKLSMAKSSPGKAAIKQTIDWAIEKLKKNNRIVWFLRTVKLKFLISSEDPKDQILLNREIQKFAKNGIDLSPESYARDEVFTALKHLSISTLETTLGHFFTDTMVRNVPEIANYDFGFKPWNQVIEELTAIENESGIDDNGGAVGGKYDSHRYVTGEEARNDSWVEVLPINDVWGWWVIEKNSSRLLARSMSDSNEIGHCGTCQNNNSTILVLVEVTNRKKNNIERRGYDSGDTITFVPHLSFELSSSGNLLQTKGYKNSKPSKKYHKYIVDMLVNIDEVTGIKGGNYMPETDFKFEDLSEEQQDQVLEAKPEINNTQPEVFEEWHKNGPSDLWMELFRTTIDSSIEWVETPPPEDERDRNIEVGYDPWMTVKDFVESCINIVSLSKDPYFSKYSNDVSRFLKMSEEEKEFPLEDPEDLIDAHTHEEEVVGGEFEHKVTPGLIEEVFMAAVHENPTFLPGIIRYLRKKGEQVVEESPEEIIHILLRSRGPASFATDLLKRAVMYGLKFGEATSSPDKDEKFVFMAYIASGFYVGPFYSQVDGWEEKTSLSDFFSLKLYLKTTAQSLMDHVEEYASYREMDYDDVEELYGDGGMLEDEWDRLREDVKDSYGYESWKEENPEEVEKALSRARSFYHEKHPPQENTIQQQVLPGLELPEGTHIDIDKSLLYLFTKIRSGILEKKSLVKKILCLINEIKD